MVQYGAFSQKFASELLLRDDDIFSERFTHNTHRIAMTVVVFLMIAAVLTVGAIREETNI